MSENGIGKSRISVWTVFGRSFVIALALYVLLIKCGISGWRSALQLGAFLWIFPVFILLGSILHANYSIGLALIHAGDWLVQLLVLSVIIGGRQKIEIT